MAKTYETHFLLGAKVQSSVGKSFSKVQNNMKNIRKSASYTESSYKKLGRTIKTALGAAGIYFSGRAIITQLNASTDAAMTFEDQMADVATLLDGEVSAKIAKASMQTKKLAIDTGITTTSLNKGYYETISAIGNTADTYAIFQKAAENARAGNVDVNESVKFLSVNMKGYGNISKEAAQKISDLGFQTIKLGQTTFPELSANMGKVIPLAGSMGAKMESVYGAMATLTGVTGNTAEVSTQLRGVFKSFIKPSTAMEKAIHAMGFESGSALIKAKGLQGSLKLLNKVTGGSKQKMGALFGEVESLNAVLALTGAQSDTFTQKTQAMYNAVGKSNEAFQKKINTSKALRQRFGQLINVLKITAGNKVLPVINKGLSYMLKNYDGIAASAKKAMQPVVGTYHFVANNWGKIKPIIVGVTGAMIAYKTVSLALIAVEKKKMIMTAINKAFATAEQTMNAYRASTMMASKAQVILNLAMSANPAAVIAIAVGALVTAGYFLYKNWDKVSKFFTGLWNGPLNNKKVQKVLAVFMPFVGIPLLIIKNWDKVSKFFVNLWGKIGPIINKMGGFFGKIFGGGNNKATVQTQSSANAAPVKGTNVPMLAKGTNSFAGGLAIVGERGPELINMPQGTQVTPASRTEKILQLVKETPSRAETLLKNLTNNTINNNNSASISVNVEQIINGNPDKKILKESNQDLEDKIEKVIKKIMGDPRTSFA